MDICQEEVEPLDTFGFSPYDTTHPARAARYIATKSEIKVYGMDHLVVPAMVHKVIARQVLAKYVNRAAKTQDEINFTSIQCDCIAS